MAKILISSFLNLNILSFLSSSVTRNWISGLNKTFDSNDWHFSPFSDQITNWIIEKRMKIIISCSPVWHICCLIQTSTWFQPKQSTHKTTFSKKKSAMSIFNYQLSWVAHSLPHGILQMSFSTQTCFHESLISKFTTKFQLDKKVKKQLYEMQSEGS